jgi:uncharacterized protein (DUF924 family)
MIGGIWGMDLVKKEALRKFCYVNFMGAKSVPKQPRDVDLDPYE